MDNVVYLNNAHKLYIKQMDNPDSPNDDGNTDIFLVYDHRQFSVKRDGYEPRDIFEYLEDCHEQRENDKYDNYFIFTVYAYIHGGVSLSLGYNGDRWDTSSSGYILVDKNDIDFDLQRKNNPEFLELTNSEIAERYAEGLIEQWNTYLSGDVYCFKLIKVIDQVENLVNLMLEQFDSTRYLDDLGKDFFRSMARDILTKNISEKFIEEEIDSCCGFYGDDIKTNGILDYIPKELIPEQLMKEV